MASFLTQLRLLVFLLATTTIFASNDPNCGTKGLPPQPDTARIIGGQDAKPHEFPWMCSVQGAVFGPEIAHVCGGAILTKRWILTAGHCTYSEREVLCGVHNLEKLEGTEVRANVTRVVTHPHPHDDPTVNDIALLKLDRDLDLTDPNLGSVCIPDAEPLDQIAGNDVIATGWGLTDNPDQYNSTILQKATMKVWTHADCQKQWLTVNGTISDGMICFGGGNKSVCHGDSGGPLNYFRKDEGRWYTYGVTSFGADDTCQGPIPPVDTRVSAYAKWIWEEISKDSE